MTSRAAATAALERRLGLSFNDPKLLNRALTHASKLGQGRSGVEHNERLEFLGDRVLGLAMADELSRREPDAEPAVLAKRFAYLVSRQACAEVARAIGLAEALDVPKQQGLRHNETALADACEALMAAVYLDQGFERARSLVVELWREQLDRPLDLNLANPKTALQEWAASLKQPLPEYRVLWRRGPDHAPTFCVEVKVEGFAPSTAEGGSRQAAEKLAAQALLEREGAT